MKKYKYNEGDTVFYHDVDDRWGKCEPNNEILATGIITELTDKKIEILWLNNDKTYETLKSSRHVFENELRMGFIKRPECL